MHAGHLVTGASGLVGRAAAAELCAGGDCVVETDRSASGEGIERVIDCDLRDIHRLHRVSRPDRDTIIHCGAHSGPMVARENPYDLIAKFRSRAADDQSGCGIVLRTGCDADADLPLGEGVRTADAGAARTQTPFH